MILAIIVFLVTFAYGLLCGLDARNDPTDASPWYYIGWATFWGIVVGIAVSWFIGVTLFKEVDSPNQVTPIVSLSDTTGVEGHGGLFYISINSIGEYVYYIENSNGNYEQRRIDSAGVEIDEQPTENPRLVTECEKIVPYDGNWFIHWGTSVSVECGYDPVFIVPPGTVIQDFNLDGDG